MNQMSKWLDLHHLLLPTRSLEQCHFVTYGV